MARRALAAVAITAGVACATIAYGPGIVIAASVFAFAAAPDAARSLG